MQWDETQCTSWICLGFLSALLTTSTNNDSLYEDTRGAVESISLGWLFPHVLKRSLCLYFILSHSKEVLVTSFWGAFIAESRGKRGRDE